MLKICASFAFALILLSNSAFAHSLIPLSGKALQQRLKLLNYTPWNGHATLRSVNQDWDCLIRDYDIEVVNPSTNTIEIASITLMLPLRDEPVPFLMIVPTILGPSQFERGSAEHFCRIGVASAIADVIRPIQPPSLPYWGYEDLKSRLAIASLRTILDFIQTDADIDSNRMSAMGLSIGGIITATLAAVEPKRLKAVVIVAAGGNLPHTLAYSVNNIVSHLRESRMNALGWTDPSTYEQKLRDTVQIDPIYFANLVDASRVFMVMAASDTTVPYVTQEETLTALHNPESLVSPAGHLGTIISLTQFFMYPVDDFLRKKLGNF